MTLEYAIYLVVAILWAAVILQGIWQLASGIRFIRYINAAVTQPTGGPSLQRWDHEFHPPAAVILPCCGVDEWLHRTVEQLARQNYPDYEIIFTFESQTDPAYAAVEKWTADWGGQSSSFAVEDKAPALASDRRSKCFALPRRRLVVAGLTQHSSQKIHNLLAAVEAVSSDREVLVFLDSDAVPHRDWLARLVAPLADPTTGAGTGFRWYSARGSLANGVRSCWNAASVTLLHEPSLAFCWGGSTSIRRETFDKLDIRRRWSRALSDDYQVTRALYDAGLKIRFVPQALIPSHDKTTMRGFLQFARRQLIITRVCGPEIWRAAMFLCINFVTGGTAIATLFFAALFGWLGNSRVMWLALVGWLMVLAIAAAKALLRQIGVRKVLGPPDLTWHDFAWDVGGTNLSGLLHLGLMFSAARSNRFVWRTTEYEMISPDETRVIRRLKE